MSCIIPTRDRAAFVGEALASALAQTGCTLEVIVVDDGSRDATEAVLAGFGGQIRVEHTDGVGVAAARNRGLRAARGSFIAFLDSDDVWHAGKLAAQLDLMRARPEVGLCFTDYTVSERDAAGWRVVQSRRHADEPSLRRLVERNFTGTLTIMARRALLSDLGGFDASLARGSDYHMWLRVAKVSALGRVPGIFADYRWHADSLTGASRRRNLTAHIDVITSLAASDPGLFTLAGVEPATLLADVRGRLAALGAA